METGDWMDVIYFHRQPFPDHEESEGCDDLLVELRKITDKYGSYHEYDVIASLLDYHGVTAEELRRAHSTVNPATPLKYYSLHPMVVDNLILQHPLEKQREIAQKRHKLLKRFQVLSSNSTLTCQANIGNIGLPTVNERSSPSIPRTSSRCNI
jgi:hypothetical protein